MLSLRRCRDLIDPSARIQTDDELAVIREQLYSLAALLIDSRTMTQGEPRLGLLKGDNASALGSKHDNALRWFRADERDEIEERAAILEFDAKTTRDEAERAAIAMTLADWKN
ncbi:MAG TPA: hypothetical protein VLL54_16425 [Pyrinomonadaceae bacterium]|nr:hypothetical protein [Pyrinomonadaceae bacterium]